MILSVCVSTSKKDVKEISSNRGIREGKIREKRRGNALAKEPREVKSLLDRDIYSQREAHEKSVILHKAMERAQNTQYISWKPSEGYHSSRKSLGQAVPLYHFRRKLPKLLSSGRRGAVNNLMRMGICTSVVQG